MDILNYSFTFSFVPPGFKRGGHAALAVFQNQQLILSRKHAYPDGIFRLLGGGLNPGEDPINAAIREFEEETAVKTNPADLIPQPVFHFSLSEQSTGIRYSYDMYLYFVFLTHQSVVPSDDVDIVRHFSLEASKQNTSAMLTLDSNLVSPKNDEIKFSWADWGQVHGLLHQYVTDHWPY